MAMKSDVSPLRNLEMSASHATTFVVVFTTRLGLIGNDRQLGLA